MGLAAVKWDDEAGFEARAAETGGRLAPAARARLMQAQQAQLHLRADDPGVFADVGAAMRLLLSGSGTAAEQDAARRVMGLPMDWKRASGDPVCGGVRGSALAALAVRGTLGAGVELRRRVMAAQAYQAARYELAVGVGPAQPRSVLGQWQGGRPGPAAGDASEAACVREMEARRLCRSVEAAWAAEADGVALARVVERIVVGGETLSGQDPLLAGLTRGTSVRQRARVTAALLCRALDVADKALTGGCP